MGNIENRLIELDYQGVGEERSKTVERVYKLLGLILGHQKGENDEESKEKPVGKTCTMWNVRCFRKSPRIIIRY